MDFDERAGTWDDDETRTERTRAVAEQMQRALGERTYHRGLDFGAGTGSLSLLLADRFDEVVLVDTSRGMLEVAAGKVAAAGPTLTAKVAGLPLDLTEPGAAAAAAWCSWRTWRPRTAATTPPTAGSTATTGSTAPRSSAR